MVVNATPEMLPRMNELWNRYFGDSLEYSSFFFDSHLMGKEVFENQYVYMEDNQLVSMLTVLEADLCEGEKKQRFWYVYAVVTDEAYRGRGFAGKVLSHVLKKAEEQGAAVGLVPANEGLYTFYGKAGFETFFYKQVTRFKLEKQPEKQDIQIELSHVEPAVYKELRDEAFETKTYVKWDEHAVAYALQENENLEGQAYICNSASDFLLVCPSEGELIVRETNLPADRLKDVCNVLAMQYACSSVSVCTPVTECDSTPIKHGMIYNYQGSQKSGYLGLALD